MTALIILFLVLIGLFAASVAVAAIIIFIGSKSGISSLIIVLTRDTRYFGMLVRSADTIIIESPADSTAKAVAVISDSTNWDILS